MQTAVHRQMLSDVPVGTFLSGGLDSSSIAFFAKEIDPNLNCFTISSTFKNETGFADDLPYAKKVAKYLGLKLNVVSVDKKNFINNIEKMIYQLDEPLADPAALNTFFISEHEENLG